MTDIPRNPSLDHIPLFSFIGARVVRSSADNKVGVVSDVVRETDCLRFFTDTGIEFIVKDPEVRSRQHYSSRNSGDSNSYYIDITTLNRGVCYSCEHECKLGIRECNFYSEVSK